MLRMEIALILVLGFVAYIYGNTARLCLRASADLFRQFCGLKSLKYTK